MLTRFFRVIRIALIGCAPSRKPKPNGEHMNTSDNTATGLIYTVADYLVPVVLAFGVVALVVFAPF